MKNCLLKLILTYFLVLYIKKRGNKIIIRNCPWYLNRYTIKWTKPLPSFTRNANFHSLNKVHISVLLHSTPLEIKEIKASFSQFI